MKHIHLFMPIGILNNSNVEEDVSSVLYNIGERIMLMPRRLSMVHAQDVHS